jgi:hypothetical protein
VIECRDTSAAVPSTSGVSLQPPGAPAVSADSDNEDSVASEIDIGSLAPAVVASSVPAPEEPPVPGGTSHAAARLRQRRLRSLSVDDALPMKSAPPSVPRTSFLGDGAPSPVRVSILHLVDLAGSERVGKSGRALDVFMLRCEDTRRACCVVLAVARCERRAPEGRHVHQQVAHYAWHCHRETCQNDRNTHSVPRIKAYSTAVHVSRCAHLRGWSTLVLASPLSPPPPALSIAGGNTKTGIIVTISPSSTNISESYGSLMFALRAKQVLFACPSSSRPLPRTRASILRRLSTACT